MGKKNWQNPQHKLFNNTIHEMRKLIAKHSNKYQEQVMGTVGSVKVPYTHLTGRRQKLRQKRVQQKAKGKQQSIQYDSSMPLLAKQLPQRKQKDDFLKNQYKYRGLKTKRFGNIKNGFLQINKKQMEQINNQGNSQKKKYYKNNKNNRNNKSNKKFINRKKHQKKY